MPERPNILVVMSDQHARRMLGRHDATLQTPSLDALAADGAWFSNAYTNAPLCAPSRASFIAGRYPHELAVHGNADPLGSYEPTFAHALGAAGYETALIGRMHFLGADQHHGFERRLVGDVGSQHVGIPNDLGPFIYNSGPQPEALRNSGAGITSYQVFDQAITEAAVRALGDWDARRERGAGARPFCYVVGFMLPHSPFRAPAQTFARYDGQVRLPQRLPLDRQPDYVRRYHRCCRLDQMAESDELRSLAAYYGLVTEVDHQVGLILEALDAIGQRDQTVVVYTSDHGEHAADHHLWWKQSFYESAAGVPLIVRGPGVDRGRCVEEPVSLVDLTATLIDLAGAAGLPRMRGRSLAPLLRGESPVEARPILSELAAGSGDFAITCRMVRHDRHKYIHYHSDEVADELYDLEADPAEQHNLLNDKHLRSVRDRLHGLVFADGWDPQRINRAVADSAQRGALLSQWSRCIDPADPWCYLRKLPVQVNQGQ